MSNLVTAINVGIAINTLINNLLQTQMQINSMLSKAQSENRDLTDEEIQQINDLRADAMKRWDSVK